MFVQGKFGVFNLECVESIYPTVEKETNKLFVTIYMTDGREISYECKSKDEQHSVMSTLSFIGD